MRTREPASCVHGKDGTCLFFVSIFHFFCFSLLVPFFPDLHIFVLSQVADSKINIPAGSEALGLFKAIENLNTALAAVEAAGLKVVNVGAGDVVDSRPASILGLSWQLLRVHQLAQIKLKVYLDSRKTNFAQSVTLETNVWLELYCNSHDPCEK